MGVFVPKVLHIVISMGVGGAERLIYDMVRYPAFAENPPVICCMDSVGDLGEKLRGQGYKVYCRGRKPGLDYGMIWWLKKMIEQEQADVVHAHQYSPLFYAAPAAFLAGLKKVVYTEHGRFYPDHRSWKRALFNPFLAKGVDHLVSISAATAEAMAINDNFPPQRIKVIHNGIDCSAMNPEFDQQVKRRELGLSDKCQIVGTAARLNSIKNIQMMLRGFKLLLQKVPDCNLIIAGEGDEKEVLKKLTQELGIAERVSFIGLRFDLPEIYKLFDVFLLTSFSEGISVTLLEAMASGVPVVVTNVGGNPEVVVQAKSGFLVPVDNDVLFASRMTELLSNSILSQSIGCSARQRIEKLFSIDNMVREYLKIYKNNEIK